MITRLEPMALSVANVDRSIAFYGDLLGFEVFRVLGPRPSSAYHWLGEHRGALPPEDSRMRGPAQAGTGVFMR